MKQLIINADDFGFTCDVNAGIVDAHRDGILTSTTIMANGEAFADAVRCARDVPSLGVGCHLVLVGGASVLNGQPFPKNLTQLAVALSQRQIDVYRELRAQIQKVLSAGIQPTHLDSHKHTHIIPHVFKVVVRLAQEFQISFVRLPLDETVPLSRVPVALASRYYRGLARRHSIQMAEHFVGFRLTGSLDESSFALALDQLPEGITEFMCHPGRLGPELANAQTRLKESRVRELQALTSPRIRDLVDHAGIRLANYGNVAVQSRELSNK